MFYAAIRLGKTCFEVLKYTYKSLKVEEVHSVILTKQEIL